MKSNLWLVIITALGIILRVHNISPFKIYPDAYQILVGARNIANFHGVVGYLGTNGPLYPTHFMLTRPIFPLLIDFFKILTADTTFISQSIALIAGIIAIPLAYFYIKTVFQTRDTSDTRDTYYGLAAATLLALSFSHTVWGGFIMLETLGVLTLLIFLFLLFKNIKEKPSFSYDFLTGLFFSVVVMTRYEYLIIIFPVVVLFFFHNYFWKRLLFFVSGLSIGLSIFVTQLFPVQDLFSVISSQLSDVAVTISLGLGSLVVLFLVFYLLSKSYKNRLIPSASKLLVVSSWLLAALLVGQIILGDNLSFLGYNLGFVRKFFIQDFLLGIFFFIGIHFLLRNKSLQTLALFVISNLVLLGAIYHQVNPQMERYMTHLIPFLLIPASYGLVEAWGRWGKLGGSGKLGRLVFLFLVVLQATTSFHGLRNLGDPSWYRTSYEEKVSDNIRQYLTEETPFLLASLPEAYFYNRRHATHGVSDIYPFIYINDSLNDKNLIVINDMGMRKNFPVFANFIDEHLKDYQMGSFRINENYHYLNQSVKETHPATIYIISVGKLKDIIETSKGK